MRKLKVLLSALLLAVTTFAFAQDITVRGVITDASTGEPLSGAAVLVKGTPKGVVADENGNYAVSVSANGTLGFTTIGFKDLEVAVEGRTEINVKLEPDSEALEEVVVIAYGTSTKSAFTGSAAVVSSDDIKKKISSNVTSALAGAAPGVQIISSNGDPTSNSPTIRIRGVGSISASNNPLIVLDGVPYDGSISDINPQDVANMTVLKDAASAAIYGHRGANGVIIITTNRGQKGDAKVHFDVRLGSNSRLIPQYDVITDPAQYYETHFRLMYNNYLDSGSYTEDQAYQLACQNIYDRDNGGLGYRVYDYPAGQQLIGRDFKLNPNATLGWSDGDYFYTPDDWYSQTFHNSFRQEYNVSVSGASEKLNYYAGAGYLDDKGIVRNSDYKRYSIRLNTDYQIKKWLKFTGNLSYTYSESQQPYYTDTYGSSGNLFYIVNTMGAIYPLYVRNADGTIKQENGLTVYDANSTNQKRPSTVGNAVRDNAYDSTGNKSDVFNGKVGLLLTPVKGLSLSANLSAYVANDRTNKLYSKFGSGAASDGAGYTNHSREFDINQQYIAEYKNGFGKHHIDVMAGYEQYLREMYGFSGSNDHLFNPFNGELANALGKENREVSSSVNKYMTQGILARVQYDFDEKVFFSASFTREASSRFAKENRWGNFWSVGAGWLINKESFLEDATWIDLLKLKVSYGTTGNDNLGSSTVAYYPYIDQYTASYNEETGEYSTSTSYKGNRTITWEKSNSVNAGVDFGLFGGYLNGTVEYFDRTTRDLLYAKDVPLSSGNPTGYVLTNVGSVRNNGVEVSLDGKIISSRNVNWTWNLNASHYKNTILALDPDIPVEEGIKGSSSIQKVGGSVYNGYMFKYAGVDPENGKALYYYEKAVDDAQGRKPDAEDWVPTYVTDKTDNFDQATKYDIGSVMPKLYGGFGTSLNAYGFDFSVQFSYQLGGKYYDGSYQAMMFSQNQTGSVMHKDLLKAWTKENPNTDVPKLNGDYSVGQSAVDRFLISSNYLSINNVTLGYTFPQKWTSKIKMSALRIYVTGENLAVFSARKGVDPRFSMGTGSFTSGTGINTGAYSAMRNITGGISVTF